MPEPNALQSLINAKRLGTREQTVLSPHLVLNPLRSVWGGIGLDPCAPEEDRIWVPCGRCKGTGMHKKKPCRLCVEPHGAWFEPTVKAEVEYVLPQDGTALPWLDRTYCNPTYDKLKDWLDPDAPKDARIAWLIPVRPHRKWWRAWARTCSTIVYLDPFAFVGHCDKYPAPMCLGYRGPDADDIEAAYAGLGGTY